MISAGATLVFALLILINPFAATNALWVFTGISMIAAAALDITTMVMQPKEK